MQIQYISAVNNKVTIGVKREVGDEAEYQEFLEKREMTDIDGHTCYSETNPKKT